MEYELTKLDPTPGKSRTTSTPHASKCSRGPTPLQYVRRLCMCQKRHASPSDRPHGGEIASLGLSCIVRRMLSQNGAVSLSSHTGREIRERKIEVLTSAVESLGNQ